MGVSASILPAQLVVRNGASAEVSDRADGDRVDAHLRRELRREMRVMSESAAFAVP